MVKKFGSRHLKVIDEKKVISYRSHVAMIKGKTLYVNENFVKFSQTTTRHINLISYEYNLNQIVVNPNSVQGLKLFKGLS